MHKFKIREAAKPKDIVEFWLEVDNGGVTLCVSGGGIQQILARIHSNGSIERVPGHPIPGLQYDDGRCIREVR